MTTLRLPYVQEFRDRHGKPRYYFRFKGKRWSLPTPGSPGFMAAYEALKKAIGDNPVGASANVGFLPGTLGWAIERFTGDKNYLLRAEATRRNERRVFDLLRKKYGAGMLKDLTPRGR